MSSETAKASLGYVTSYGAAKRGGYQGSYEEWCALMAEVADHLDENRGLYADTVTAKEAAEAAEEEAEAAALNAEAWAKGTKGGEVVPDTDPAYHNHAKHYSNEARLEKAMAEVAASQAAGSAETAEGHSKDAEAWAAGTRGGDPVESGDDAYHNNAKYYSEQSSGFADNAAGSASDAEAWATGGSGGTATATNNAKYYAEQAAESAAALVIDDTLSQSGQAADAAAVRNAITYVPMAINSFSISTPSDGLAEIGSTVTSVSLPFSLNKVPASLKLNNVAQTAAKTGTIALTEQEITSDTVFQLEAKDAGSPVHEVKTVTSSKTLSFVNRICYGAAASGTLNSAFVNALANKVLSGQKGRTFTVSVPSGQYIWYALPKGLGACTFKVGGFEGGFEAAETVSVTNASGHTEDYYVYRSTNSGLGSTTVTVS